MVGEDERRKIYRKENVRKLVVHMRGGRGRHTRRKMGGNQWYDRSNMKIYEEENVRKPMI